MNNRKLRSKYIESIKALEFEKLDMRKFYATYNYNGNYWKQPQVSPLDFELEKGQRNFNENILKPIRKHPEIILCDKVMDELEESIKRILDRLPQDECIIVPYWNKFFKAMELCYNYVKRRYENE